MYSEVETPKGDDDIAVLLPHFESKRRTFSHPIKSSSSLQFNAEQADISIDEITVDNFLEETEEGAKLKPLFEKARGGRQLPSMQVSFENVNLTASINVDVHGQTELPTIYTRTKHLMLDCFRSKQSHERAILKNVTGLFKPEQTTLVLGQPGSGKSSLMKMLSGRFPFDKTTSFTGDIRYNGVLQEDIKSKLPRYVEFVNQQDDHHPTLTVLENFEFAHKCTSGSKVPPSWLTSSLTAGSEEENTKAQLAAAKLHELYPQLIVKALGLENCKNTIVGNAMIRGVSGGERKRTTTGEMSFGMRCVKFMDSISTGLDSAATFDICNSLKKFAKTFHKTVIVALLQPAPEVFDLFDNVLLMESGYIIYNGPRDKVLGYFEDLGFKCPPRRDVADFLLDLGTDRQFQYQTHSIESLPTTGADFALCFEKSSVYENLCNEIKVSNRDEEFVAVSRDIMSKRRDFQQGFFESTQTLLKRSMKVTLRNKPLMRGRVFMYTLMGALFSATFYDSDPANAQVMLGLIFATVMFLSLGQASQLPIFMKERGIFYKQRGANFFRTSCYVISASVTQFPFAICEAFLFGSLVYWLAGFENDAGRFLLFIFFLVLTNLTMGSWFFFLASISPNVNIGKPIAIFSILFFVIFSGFVVSEENIPDYLIWIFWINPIAWCIRSLAVSQYGSSTFGCLYKGVNFCAHFGGKTAGEYFLSHFHVRSEDYWIASGAFYTVLVYFIFLFASFLTLEYKRYEAPDTTSVAFEDFHGTKCSDKNQVLMEGSPSLEHSEAVFALAVENEEKKFQPVTLAFENLWYSVPVPGQRRNNENIDLLQNISGLALPGTITALMGSSGAGKTTLMDVIAGRKTAGTIRGSIKLNGYEANELAIRRCTGYCEQMDIHSESATIREALTFSAFLRQDSSISDQHKQESVQECLDLLELNNVADSIIRGSSSELLKRLTIGVELAAQPSILFLDEPTSGLDARSAKIIMTGVRKIADSGRTIVCTIHQPSSEVFAMFDSLLLLKRGGETVFFGDLGGAESKKLVKYFQNIPGTPSLKAGYNPATWMLDVIGAGVGHETIDYAAVFQASEQHTLLKADFNQPGVLTPCNFLPEMHFKKKRASFESTQLKFLTCRFLRMYWRTPSYNLVRIALNMISAVLFGVIYTGSDYSTYSGVNSGVGMIFMVTVFMGMISFISVLPVYAEERTAFYRERACQTYNALWYFVGSTLAEIPYVLFSTFIFCAIFYPFVGFNGYGSFFEFWLIFMAFILLQVYFGQFTIYALPSIEVAAILGILMNAVFVLFMGFNPPADQIPAGLKWIYHIAPPTYCMSALGAIVFGDGTKLGAKLMENAPSKLSGLRIQDYVEVVFKMKQDNVWRNLYVLIGFIIVFRILALLALRYINHLKR